ncbi:hypothetical protein BJ875DRAFT_481916 [Amylocarpus encephaloides]|uniref:Uncharacterized protein n=1 Tax=Amylocarpus encephaloides TaxID=45428 RepID=A0A9P7YN88_9HELO|nr:hypothetical protein BJ875DRAFT_481916 [Amylocarpus encephaloides]
MEIHSSPSHYHVGPAQRDVYFAFELKGGTRRVIEKHPKVEGESSSAHVLLHLTILKTEVETSRVAGNRDRLGAAKAKLEPCTDTRCYQDQFGALNQKKIKQLGEENSLGALMELFETSKAREYHDIISILSLEVSKISRQKAQLEVVSQAIIQRQRLIEEKAVNEWKPPSNRITKLEKGVIAVYWNYVILQKDLDEAVTKKKNQVKRSEAHSIRNLELKGENGRLMVLILEVID